MTGYYIYYKVAPHAIADGATVMTAVFDEVHAATGIRGRLLRRADDEHTWMEVFEPVDGAAVFERVLAAALTRHGFARLLEPNSRRVVERFVPVVDARV